MRVACSLLVALALVACASAVQFKLDAGSLKCLKEDVYKDVLVVGEYDITEDANSHVILEIKDSRGHPVYRKEDALKGKFAFTSDDNDVFDICFLNNPKDADNIVEHQRNVHLDVKAGVEARSYDKVAEAEKLKPLELELRRLEDLSESIVLDFARMKKREEEHRDTNESTNSRLLNFSIFSMVCLLVLALWQVLYLKRYFKQKKLI
eukprot:m.31940 g.31940  ORF g.31940 m.31940 type:complete len:207 (-) comp10810_c0_seq1:241-861(-)